MLLFSITKLILVEIIARTFNHALEIRKTEILRQGVINF